VALLGVTHIYDIDFHSDVLAFFYYTESGESKEATYSLEKISEIFLTASSSKV
jgi:hypothetical protein